MLTMAVGVASSPFLGEDSFSLALREEDDPDCCGTGYSISPCSDTAACDGSDEYCCPVVANGVSGLALFYGDHAPIAVEEG